MKYREHEWSNEVRYWIEHNLKNYETRNNQKVIEAEHIIDYLLSDKAPKRLKRMSIEEALHNSKRWTNALVKRGNNIIETEEDIKIIKDLGNGLELVKLLSEDAYKREGAMMRHCAASYYTNESCYIYSIRDSKNQSHCTLEILRNKDGGINQIKGKGNGKIHPKYIKYVIKALNLLGQIIRSSELRYLGYVNLDEIDSGYTEWVKEHVPDAKFMTYKGVEYVNEQSIS